MKIICRLNTAILVCIVGGEGSVLRTHPFKENTGVNNNLEVCSRIVVKSDTLLSELDVLKLPRTLVY